MPVTIAQEHAIMIARTVNITRHPARADTGKTSAHSHHDSCQAAD